MTAQDIAALIASVGGGAIGLKLVEAGLRWFTGRASRGRAELDRLDKAHAAELDRLRSAYSAEITRVEGARVDAVRRAERAETNADNEASYRRIVSEHASTVRRTAVDHGVDDNLFPPFPPRPAQGVTP